MENKNLDISKLIGFALIGAILVWYSFTNNSPKENNQNKQTVSQSVPSKKENKPTDQTLATIEAVKKYGDFSYNNIKGIPADATTTIENEKVKIVIANKGGQIVNAQLKGYTTYDKKPLEIVKNGNANFNLNFTVNQRNFNTDELVFEPIVSKQNGNTIATLKLKVSENQFLEYVYVLKPNDYMLDFSVHTIGLQNILNTNKPVVLNWDLKSRRQEKSIKYENQMSALHYEKEDAKYDELSAGNEDDETEENVDWIGYKQHFFSTILVSNKPFEKANIRSKSLVEGESEKAIYTKKFSTTTNLKVENGAINYDFKFYIGPNDYKTLSSYEKGIENVMNLGWGIFGWLNKVVFIPIFNILSSFISNYGLVIILMTLVVRLIMSPLVYKSYVSSAKMKILKPEMDLINQKFPGKENQLKRQTEIMALQRKSGVNMLAGCIPALLQMPVFFALFRFFPSEIGLRQQGFLWAEDLSSYDSVYEWTTNIPLISSIYGNHLSVFPILASIAIFFYMQMNQSQQMSMQPPAQDGMPDMQKMMKMMMYLSPIMMLFFFNNYASGLSLYYFISNLLTLLIMFVVKNYVISEEKILAKIHENRQKPKKQSKFRQRLDDAMKQAQEQQANSKK